MRLVRGTIAFQQIAARLRGQSAWSARVGIGSMITLEFGKPTARGRTQSMRGAWSLWIQMAAWRIETHESMLAADEDDRATLEAAVSTLVGRPLRSASITASFDAVFTFSGRVRLRVFPCSSTEEAWALFYPPNLVFAAGPGRRGFIRRSDRPRSEFVTELGTRRHE